VQRAPARTEFQTKLVEVQTKLVEVLLARPLPALQGMSSAYHSILLNENIRCTEFCNHTNVAVRKFMTASVPGSQNPPWQVSGTHLQQTHRWEFTTIRNRKRALSVEKTPLWQKMRGLRKGFLATSAEQAS
jgi:hypothetical protein